VKRQRRWRSVVVSSVAGGLVLFGALAGCSGDDEESLVLVWRGGGLDRPTAIAVRPDQIDELWVTNEGDNSLTVLRRTKKGVVADTRQDAYGEHFTANPSGIAFTPDGKRFAVSNDSTNEVNGIDFKLQPERNTNFKNNNFMGPSLFVTETFARAGQSKAYSADWPQPGNGHSANTRVPLADCPLEYWTPEIGQCVWPREGSHIDMLHESPLSKGIVHLRSNQFLVLDGCGSGDSNGNCNGKGHVVFYDFNKDHQEGNGFHGDGVVRRYIDAPFTRRDDVSSGIVALNGIVYYADSGTGSVRSVPLDGQDVLMVGTWHPESMVPHLESGPGIISWGETGAPDGDDPANVDAWIAVRGNAANIAAAGALWIKPREVLSTYAYVRTTANRIVAGPDVAAVPAGLAATERGLLVVDNATGRVLLLDWSTFAVVRTYETGLKGLSGIAADGSAHVLLTDLATDSVYRLRL